MLAALASSIVYRSARLSRGSPPFFAAMMILRAILLQTLPRFASVAPFARLIFAQCECPAMIAPAVGGQSPVVSKYWPLNCPRPLILGLLLLLFLRRRRRDRHRFAL